MALKGGVLKWGRFSFSPLAPIPALCFSALFGIDAVFPSLLAAILHECGHLFAILCYGMGVREIAVYPFGGEIVTRREAPNYSSAIVVSLAGIAINLFISCLFFLPSPSLFAVRFAGSSLMLALLNLVPIKTLDGGAALLSFLRIFFPLSADSFMTGISRLFSIILLSFGILTVFSSGFNPSFLLISLYLFLDLL